mgnify:CR=1 FL=1
MSQINASSFLFSRTIGFYDHEIEQSLRFSDNDAPRLNGSLGTPTDAKKGTISVWIKRSDLPSANRYIMSSYDGSSGASSDVYFDTSHRLQVSFGGSSASPLVTNQVFRDVSAWFHLCIVLDSTQGTSSNRNKIYINGERVTSFSSASYPALNQSHMFSASGTRHRISTNWNSSGTLWFDGYMAEFHFVDGQALDPTDFGEFKSGIWIAKEYAGTYGNNGWYLDFANSADIGNDVSGNNNDWTPVNLTASDVVLDSPTNNFNTFSSVIRSNSGSLSEGNLKSSSVSGGSSNYGPMSSYNVDSGKWYFEFRITGGTANDIYAGAFYARTDNSIRFGKDMAAVYNGKIYADGVAVQTGLANPATNDVFGFAVDVDNSTCQVYRNGSAYGTLVDFSSSSYISNGFMGMGHYHGSSSTNSTAVVNYGQDSTFAGATAAGGNADENGYGEFAYAVPSGFLAMCSANLPSGAIDTLADETPEDYFNTVLWTGNNTNNRSITGVGFQPSLVSAKSRSANSGFNWVDAVRGGTKNLQSNNTNAEATTNTVISFDSDGFTVGDGNGYDINKSGEPIVGWSWKANGAGVSNTDGSITSTVSVGATSQQNWFSISQYTGTGSSMTFGHGLGVKPDLFIVKKTNSADEWIVYPLGATGNLTQYLKLHSTSGYTSDSVLETANSSVLGFGSSGARNGSGDDYICYAFANAEGLCKVGKYTGNGSTDGTFVFTGFRPSFVMWKRTDTTSDWFIMDVKRDIDNPTDHKLEANTSGSEVVNTAYYTDYLSNGFKLRNTNGQLNASGGNYIYLAIAEQPFKYANAR